MPRPRLRRNIELEPDTVYFKPIGIPRLELEEVIISLEEYESIRLKDLEGLGQEEAAKKMNISQPTFHRLLQEARKKITDAIVNGKAFKIKGGEYKLVKKQQEFRRKRWNE